jgi:hypothetical protein
MLHRSGSNSFVTVDHHYFSRFLSSATVLHGCAPLNAGVKLPAHKRRFAVVAVKAHSRVDRSRTDPSVCITGLVFVSMELSRHRTEQEWLPARSAYYHSGRDQMFAPAVTSILRHGCCVGLTQGPIPPDPVFVSTERSRKWTEQILSPLAVVYFPSGRDDTFPLAETTFLRVAANG